MYDILMILLVFLWTFSMILADYLLPGSVSGSGWPKWNGSRRIRIRNTVLRQKKSNVMLIVRWTCTRTRASSRPPPTSTTPRGHATPFPVARVVCPNFGHPALTSSFKVYVLGRCCRHATKIINHQSKAKISELTVHS